MVLRAYTTWLKKLVVMFLMLPKSIYLMDLINDQQKYYQIVRDRENMILTGKTQNSRSSYDKSDTVIHKTALRNKLSFDFTEDDIKKFKLWRDGVIPYYIDVVSFADKVFRDRIRWFLNEVSLMTSVNFVELLRPPVNYKTSRWVMFINRRSLLGCADHSILNFTNTGVQRVVLGYDCISKAGGLADAVLAIVGVPPQHNAPNRDDYIEILYDNIIPEKIYLYKKLQDEEWLFHDLSYDFTSAGHVSFYKHSTKGLASFRVKVLYNDTDIGNRHGFSRDDILKIKMLYRFLPQTKNTRDSKCSQLFKVGNKIEKSSLNVNEKPEDRQKLFKYLDLSTDSSDSSDYSIDSEIDSLIYMDYIGLGSNGRYEKRKTKINAHDNTAWNLKNKHSGKSAREPLKLMKNPAAASLQDPLLYLSDYTSSAEDNKTKLWKMKG